MTLEVLVSCMHQAGDALVRRSGLTGDVVVINQCDADGYAEYPTPNGRARVFSTTQRGLTKSRNMAIAHSAADICLLCDDDEHFPPDYVQRILDAYAAQPRADVLVFRVRGLSSSLGEKPRLLRFPNTMKVSSVQLSFRRERLAAAGVGFDPLLGAGTGNGGEEELKFLTDCRRAGLRICYAPVEIAALEEGSSTWFQGFDRQFFENRGATTRYILGFWGASLYAVYYILRKRGLYRDSIAPRDALRAIFRGIRQNRITAEARRKI